MAFDPIMGLAPTRAAGQATFPPLTPEEEAALIDQILAKSMGGLQYVAETLDKPGRAVRGTLAGDPAALLNLIPFSDTFGITDPKDTVWGRDLLEQAGLLGPNTPGLDFGDVLGLAAEIGVDPFTWIGLGGLRAAGGRGIAEGIRAGERGLLRVGVPFTNIAKDIGRGSAVAAKAAEIGIDPVVKFALESAPVRHGRALLDTVAQGVAQKDVQKWLDEINVPAMHQAAIAKMTEPVITAQRKAYTEVFKGLPDDLKATGIRYLRQVAEGAEIPLGDADALRAFQQANPDEFAILEEIGGDIHKWSKQWLKAEEELGMPVNALQDAYVDYAFRSSIRHSPSDLVKGFKQIFAPRAQFTNKRLEFLTDVPGGTEAINDMVRDSAISGPNALLKDDEATRVILDKYLGGGEGLEKQAKQLTKWLANLDESYARDGLPFYNDALTDAFKRANMHAKVTSRGEALMMAGERFALPAEEVLEGGITLKQLYRKVNMGKAVKQIDEEGVESTVMRALEQLEKRGNFQGRTAAEIGEMVIPNEIAEPLSKWVAGWMRPKEMGPFVEFYDKLLLFTKDWLTQMFPAFHSRNFVSGAYYNWMTDAYDPTVGFGRRYMQPYIDMAYVQQGKPVRPIKGLNSQAAFDEAVRNDGVSTLASQELHDIMKAHGVAFVGRAAQGAERVGKTLPVADVPFPDPNVSFLQEMWNRLNPLNAPGKTTKEKLARTLNPLNLSGVGGEVDDFAWMRMMRSLGNETEFNIRGSHFIAKARQAGENLQAGGRPAVQMKSVDEYIGGLDEASQFQRHAVDAEGNVVGEIEWMVGPGNGATERAKILQAFPDAPIDESMRAVNLGYVNTLGPKGQGTGQQMILDMLTHEPESMIYVRGSGDLTSALMGLEKKGAIDIRWQATPKPGQPNGAAFRLKQGVDPSVVQERILQGGGLPPEEVVQQIAGDAAASVRKTHFDYADLTEFERRIAKRWVPFWTFSKKNLPLVIENLWKRPGGKLAQTIRAVNKPRQGEGFVPEYIGEGTAIPLGEDRFLSSLGLPFENALEHLVVAPTATKTVQRTAEKAISQLTPAARFPYVMASHRDPFFGRDLGELYPYPTQNELMNAALMATPFSRAISTVRKATDPRKGLGVTAVDLLSGVKITDVSGGLERQKQFETRRVLDEILKESPNIDFFERPYVRPENMENLTPEDVLNMRLSETLFKSAREAKKKERENEQIRAAVTLGGKI